MEQIGLALILFAAFWVGGAAAYIAMRLRAQVAYEKGRSDSATEISALTERLNARDLQLTEARRHAESAAETIAGLQNSAIRDPEQRQLLLGNVMEPLMSSLDRVDSRILELERDRAAAYSSLQQQVDSMMRAQAGLQAETANLNSALRTPAARGRWGEVQLRRVVELAGMVARCDFIEPPAAIGGPDLIVQLPNARRIAVDSKVPLTAYLDSVGAVDEVDRMEKRRQYAAQVRAHVTALSAPEYWNHFTESPEFVVAFLPGESFLSAALEHDPELLEFGVERRVILATPTTLIALLRAVAWGWKQEMVSLNATEIRDLGKVLYEQLRSLAENLTEVRNALGNTTASFNRAMGAFESDVIPSARRLNEIIPPPPKIEPAVPAAVASAGSAPALLSLHSALSNGDTNPLAASAVPLLPEFIPLEDSPQSAETPVHTPL